MFESLENGHRVARTLTGVKSTSTSLFLNFSNPNYNLAWLCYTHFNKYRERPLFP